ncbi:MAG: RNA-binding protein [Planctomycetes bacterium]|nr:RNA-binding protein [Planctomycetota bacterium]MBL7007612.1 RNA-binding protein [Planctomycetota bacterium]
MNIYVGNLPFTVDDDELRDLFAQFGDIQSAKIIMDRETGRPRGFGFVEMGDADGQKAIEALNGFSMQGRELRINEAQPREDRGPRGGGGGGGGGGGRNRW